MAAIIPKADFTSFKGAAFEKIRNPNSKAFPRRVINVKDTIRSDGAVVFFKPDGWNFHILSHRWIKEIEELAAEVEKRLQESQETYELVLRKANFKKMEGYKGLIELLKILLEADKVKFLWLDTLCINQSDKLEKAAEILHMGEFYSLSLGCYVAPNGVGGGFAGADKCGFPPDWFSRAWTLQEFLLPSKLTFLVEMMPLQFNAIVSFVKKAHVEKKCACGGSSGWAWGSAEQPSKHKKCTRLEDPWHCLNAFKQSRPPLDERNFWNALKKSDYTCTRGRFAYGSKVSGSKVVYLVDRNAYIPLAYIITNESNHIWRLGIRLGLVCQGGSVALVNEIADRDCKSEEDRALCMLALLGIVVGEKEIEVGKTLDHQLVVLTKGMVKCNVDDLVKILAVAILPSFSATQTMTWMPTLRKRMRSADEVLKYMIETESSEGVRNMKDFVGKVNNLTVDDRGFLGLTCHFMTGSLVPFDEHKERCTHVTNKKNGKGCASCCRLNEIHENCFHGTDEEWVLEMAEGHALPFHSSNELGAGFQGRAFWPHLMGTGNMNYVYPWFYFMGGLLIQSNQDISKVSLLLLGESIETRTMGREKVLLFLVCVGESPGKLRKIGHVRTLPDYPKLKASSKIDYECLPKVRCTIE